MSSKPLVAEAPVASDPTILAGPAFSAPPWQRFARRGATMLFLAALFLPGVLYADDEFNLNLYTRYMAYALFAMSVDLVWGYTGLLSLGQGVFFGLGAYALGYSLILQGAEKRGLDMPDFMIQCRLEAIPAWIAALHDNWVGILVGLVLPTLVAIALGTIMFQRKIKGVYFSLFTQAVLMAFFVFINNQRPYTGGVDGLTSLSRFSMFGYEFVGSYELFFLVTGILVACFIALSILLEGKFGKVLTAIRDNEFRVMALGYNTAMYKAFAYAIAGFLAGMAGVLHTAANRSAGPQFFGIAFSIEIVIWVAVGGRGTLIGAILGTLIVNVARTYLNDNQTGLSAVLKTSFDTVAGWMGSSEKFTEPAKLWPIWLGSLFIVVVLFLPDGILGFLNRITARVLRPSHANPDGSN